MSRKVVQIKVESDFNRKLGGGFKYCLFSPRTLGKMNHFDEHSFQVGGSTTN